MLIKKFKFPLLQFRFLISREGFKRLSVFHDLRQVRVLGPEARRLRPDHRRPPGHEKGRERARRRKQQT